MRAGLATAAILAGACGGPPSRPAIVAEPVPVRAATPYRLGLAPVEPAAWLEPPLDAPVDDPFGDVTVVALGQRAAVLATDAGYFGAHLDLGVSGPLVIPPNVTWVGLGGEDDQVLVTFADGSLYAAVDTQAAASGFARVGQVKGATAWAATVHRIVAAAGERVFVSRDGRKFRSQRVEKGFAAQQLHARVDGVIAVTGTLAGETVTFVSTTGATWTRGAIEPTCPQGRSFEEMLQAGTTSAAGFATVLADDGPCVDPPPRRPPPSGTRSGVTLLWGGSVLVFDRVTGDAEVIAPPSPCRPVGAWDARGLRVVACEPGEAFTFVDGAWQRDGLLDADTYDGLQVADDGTAAIRACTSQTCGVRVRAPDGGWRALAPDGVTAYRLLPGGGVIAIANGALVHDDRVLVAHVPDDASIELVDDTILLGGFTVHDDGTIRDAQGNLAP